jgi:polysaccharide export outer membrane protein
LIGRSASSNGFRIMRRPQRKQEILMTQNRRSVRAGLKVAIVGSTLALAACATLPADGPSTRAVKGADEKLVGGASVAVVNVTDAVAGKLANSSRAPSFADIFGDVGPHRSIVGHGDGLTVSVWEAPPSVLFSTPIISSREGGSEGSMGNSRATDLPMQFVDGNGKIDVPFAGAIQAAGRTTDAIARDIQGKLRLKAHDPQVFVRLSSNLTADVTIVGEVARSTRMPLTPKGERLLDALAMAGGTRQPTDKMTVQVTRGSTVDAMPLKAVINDPSQNIRLQANDVITLLFQPYSFTVLGAAKNTQEFPFEGTGLTLSQALGRMGGLQDQRANPRGVFVFRFEEPEIFGGEQLPVASKAGKIPVIYRVDLKDPKTLFVAQSFPIKDKDVIYVSNAPLADFSKFLQAVSQVVYPIATIQNTNIF